jgi:predicted metal-dependent peptidase
MLGQALGEVDGAITGLGVPGEQVTVLACDAAVSTVQTVRRAKDLRLGGGGGTDMRVGIDRAARSRPRPDVVIVVTDGYTPWPGQAPAGVALVAALIHRSGTTPPPAPSWARVVTCELS